MAMTASVKDELSRIDNSKPCCRRSEMSALFRFAGGLHLVGGSLVVEAELDAGSVARRLRAAIQDAYGYDSEMQVLTAGGLRRHTHYVLRVINDGEALARQTGLLDARGRPVRGLPAHVVAGNLCCAEAAWRGAFMAHGSLTEPGRSSSLEITCPGPESALALVGAARRLGITAKARDARGVDRVVIRDGDAIGQLLVRLGAHAGVLAWEERRVRREVRATANRLANFDDANLRRSARAAVAAAAKVSRALELLGDEVPGHLAEAGRLRLANRQASLEELGAMADPPLTKDAIAGRIRRLINLANKHAAAAGEPPVEAVVTDEMLVA
ncbi:DNA-binding protein WhiA [Stackebrandtia nassauensis]|uniref:Probable cell division protein WhiA n=1 Tax=Stackebrandtia nassauensis (strain DSM 44728 / CIP 108903 / NRRL B-16338 / NBRC 102104 / LLR-40K-21) TaxID=446470 RepID=D3Q9H0_STANL|nr:DNA-binding protein WhiA [Stackebrandtia nassauensis]ADD42652.1 protein of unknown function DUF199 [Stackebrandtia nassauensis DSM 44728]